MRFEKCSYFFFSGKKITFWTQTQVSNYNIIHGFCYWRYRIFISFITSYVLQQSTFFVYKVILKMGCTVVSTGYFILYGQFFFFPKRFNGCEDLSFISTRHVQKKRIVGTVGIGSKLKGFDQKMFYGPRSKR